MLAYVLNHAKSFSSQLLKHWLISAHDAMRKPKGALALEHCYLEALLQTLPAH
jgi:hypothetical protein